MKFDEKAIVAAIQEAEGHTSGEICVHITNHAFGDIFVKAKVKFKQLGLTCTKERNGILFYIAKLSHKFAIVGDVGIHERVQQEFWDELSSILSAHFSRKEFTVGLCAAIHACGQKLKQHFPAHEGDVNELSNTVSRD